MSGPLKAAQVWFRRNELAAASASSVDFSRLASVTRSTQPSDKNKFSFWLRLAHPLHPSFQAASLWLLPAVLLLGLQLVALTGQVKGLTCYVGA